MPVLCVEQCKQAGSRSSEVFCVRPLLLKAFGFVASLLFFADLPLFWKNKGSPLPTDKKAAPPNGGPANRDGEAPPEMESLNRTANGTE